MTRLLYLVSHPIQYQAPLLRRIAADPDIHLTVLFERMDTAGAYYDPGFGAEVTWDSDLTAGYAFAAARSLDDVERHLLDADAFWVHGWDSGLKRRALEMARRRGVPALMRGENTIAAMPDGGGLHGILKRAYLRWIFYRCTAFLCIGSDNRDYYRRHGIADDRLFAMPYAVDNEAFTELAAAADPTAVRRDLELQPGRPVVLFAGKFQARKSPVLLLEAMQRLDRAAAHEPYLLYVGSGEDEGRLRAAAGDADWVRFLGFRNQAELPALYALADLFVLPSEREPWGLAVNEAMACGTAVVATDECGCAADLIDDACGRVVPAGVGPPLVEALTDLLGDAERLAHMGRAAQTRIAVWSYAEDVEGLKAALSYVASLRRPA
ncbi:MAG: glycosyltransferase family 4 protein [Rhodospirillaceae bacterium]